MGLEHALAPPILRRSRGPLTRPTALPLCTGNVINVTEVVYMTLAHSTWSPPEHSLVRVLTPGTYSICNLRWDGWCSFLSTPPFLKCVLLSPLDRYKKKKQLKVKGLTPPLLKIRFFLSFFLFQNVCFRKLVSTSTLFEMYICLFEDQSILCQLIDSERSFPRTWEPSL